MKVVFDLVSYFKDFRYCDLLKCRLVNSFRFMFPLVHGYDFIIAGKALSNILLNVSVIVAFEMRSPLYYLWRNPFAICLSNSLIF